MSLEFKQFKSQQLRGHAFKLRGDRTVQERFMGFLEERSTVVYVRVESYLFFGRRNGKQDYIYKDWLGGKYTKMVHCLLTDYMLLLVEKTANNRTRCTFKISFSNVVITR